MSEFDFSNVIGIKSQYHGEIKAITDAYGVEVWGSRMHTNLVPTSTDTDGSIYNGVGYKDNVRLSSSGGISGSAQSGSTTTGFIPVNGAKDVMRIKGVEWVTALGSGKHFYFNYYDANKKFLDYISSAIYSGGTVDHILTVTRDDKGVETVQWSQTFGTTNVLLQHVRSASYVRITAKGQGANMVVTLNEEILI